METYNEATTHFIFLGLFPPSRIGLFLFILVILIFLMTLIGNISVIFLILPDTRLHTLVYFLLSRFSLMDLNHISTIVPRMAYNFLFENKSVSFIGCGVQSFFFVTLAGAEPLLLASVAYDRYVAICFPLHYPIHLSRNLCVLVTIGSSMIGCLNVCAHNAYELHTPYCRSKIINHFFCDLTAILALVCMDTWTCDCIVFVFSTLFLVLLSLALHVPMAEFSLPSTECPHLKGRRKPIQPAEPTSLW
nr:olfactory receptor 2L3-like [Loxodonta africana]